MTVNGPLYRTRAREEGVTSLWLRSLLREQIWRLLSPNFFWWKPHHPRERVIIYVFSTVRERVLLTFVLSGSFYKTFLKHKWYEW